MEETKREGALGQQASSKASNHSRGTNINDGDTHSESANFDCGFGLPTSFTAEEQDTRNANEARMEALNSSTVSVFEG